MKKAYAYKISKHWGLLIHCAIFIDMLYNVIKVLNKKLYFRIKKKDLKYKLEVSC